MSYKRNQIEEAIAPVGQIAWRLEGQNIDGGKNRVKLARKSCRSFLGGAITQFGRHNMLVQTRVSPIAEIRSAITLWGRRTRSERMFVSSRNRIKGRRELREHPPQVETPHRAWEALFLETGVTRRV
jgi:hypothetical protein